MNLAQGEGKEGHSKVHNHLKDGESKMTPLPKSNTSFVTRSWSSTTRFRVFGCCLSVVPALRTVHEGLRLYNHQ
jgi:hypothetical protein